MVSHGVLLMSVLRWEVFLCLLEAEERGVGVSGNLERCTLFAGFLPMPS